MDGYKSEYHRKDARFDASQELESKVHEELLQVAAELEQKLAAYGLDRLVEKIAKLTETHSLREWKRVCKDTLGIDLLSDLSPSPKNGHKTRGKSRIKTQR